MIKSSSNRSTNRHGSVLNNTSATHHRRSMPFIFKNSRSAKKQLSLNLNKADFEICQAPDEDEMLEYMHRSTSQENNNTNQSDVTVSDDTITDQQQQSLDLYNSTSSSTRHKSQIFSKITHRITPYRNDHTKRNETDQEKNQGFLLIDQVDGDLIVIQNDNTDQQHTRHAEACEHGLVDNDTVDIDQIQLESTTPVTPHLVPPSIASSILPVINHSTHELDIQATQAGIECGTPGYDESTVHDTQVSATNSSSSTNSSNNEPHFSSIDRTILNDIDYVIEQKRDLERITVYEIALNNDRRDYQQDLPQNENDEISFNLHYKDTIEKNLRLKEEIKQLKDQNSRIYSPWSCEVCTYINEPFAKTRKDVCEMCEGPSPLKKHTLTS